MSQKEYDILVFIGRFEPWHNGHARVAAEALERADNVIIMVGSSNAPRDARNPWTFEERHNLIQGWYLSQHSTSNLSIVSLDDHTYQDSDWEDEVQRRVNVFIENSWGKLDHKTAKIGLIGHSKDHTSYYLKKFPQWGNIDVRGYDDSRLLDASWIRNMYFNEYDNADLLNQVIPALVPESTSRFLDSFKGSPEFNHLLESHSYIERYKREHPGINVTVDAVVVQSGHLLVVERQAHPGKGLLSIPGTFLKEDLTAKDAIISMLENVTRLKVATRVLRGSLSGVKMYDDPHRSPRGRIITHAHCFELEAQVKLPKVQGNSAKRAFWMPISELDPINFFEDHYFIAQDMIKRHIGE